MAELLSLSLSLDNRSGCKEVTVLAQANAFSYFVLGISVTAGSDLRKVPPDFASSISHVIWLPLDCPDVSTLAVLVVPVKT